MKNRLGEINIIINQDKNDNLTYTITNSNERGVTACYTGDQAIKEIKEMIAKILIS